MVRRQFSSGLFLAAHLKIGLGLTGSSKSKDAFYLGALVQDFAAADAFLWT